MLLDRNKQEKLIAVAKRAHNWTGFVKRENQANYLIGSAQLSDSSNVFIPGLTMEIEIKAPIHVERCLFLFTLRQRLTGKRPRIYQLDVCPRDKRSHNGDPVIYGPHEHFFDEEVHAVVDNGVNCENWRSSLSWFLRQANILDMNVEWPC